ncbi:MAG: 16S rRNA (cytosine(1402)-N(4))-methyltransferase RsmH [Candidatus Pacebacteria bacterium]|nr:16S rRNA (cytosine(1402)-N(4))-methyltransferase RsmH [Candidatus Paceibacterota bacterium]
MQQHHTVLLKESIDGLNLEPRDVVVDGTVGQGGHAALIAERVGPHGTVLMLDADESSLAAAKERLAEANTHLIYVHGNFRAIKEHAARAGITSADGILFDLGWHQGQMESGRGFSFREDAPLLMTLTTNPEPYQVTAADIIGNWNEDELVTLFREYGGERFAGRIARTIVETRVRRPITTSKQLADVVQSAVPGKFRGGRIHPATKVFQALRIAVNDELEALKEGIASALQLLAPNGRLAIITFHSLEDKIVKEAFKQAAVDGMGTLITKKPTVPGRSEVLVNRRARSAKLRIFQKHA